MNHPRKWYNGARENWQEASSEEHFLKIFLGNFLVCFVVFMLVVQWLKYNSLRHGMIVNDPVYNMLEPRDFSPWIFFFTYSGTISAVLYLLCHPQLMLRGFTGFVVLFLVRALCIFLIPLSPSGDLVPLHDPFTNFMANEDSIYNDLFFSGHVAALAFYYFIVRDTWLKRYLMLCAIMIAILLVWQRVHYTLDVLAAPVFSYFCYWAVVEKDIIWSSFLKKSPDGKNSHSPVAE